MGKDPAFLFYSKDWIEGTAEFLPDEKGIYIDLLAHQHQKGDLPSEEKRLARIVGLSHDEFLKVWDQVGKKFEPIDTPNGVRLANKKMSVVMGERSEKGKKNKIIGTFAHVITKLNLNNTDKSYLKSEFNVNDFVLNATEWNTERLTEWCRQRLAFIGTTNEDKDNKEKRKEKFIAEVEKVNAERGYLDDRLLNDQAAGFIPYWTESGDRDIKMRFEKERSFSMNRRLAKWKTNAKEWTKGNRDDMPSEPNSVWESNCKDPNLLSEARQLWRDNGWTYEDRGAGGRWIRQ